MQLYSTFSLGGSARPFATDLEGRTIWYSVSTAGIYRVLPGGHFLAVAEGMNSVNKTKDEQVPQELDLLGNIDPATKLRAE